MSLKVIFSSFLLLLPCGAMAQKLVYRCDFSHERDLDDWVMEGPGVAKIVEGRLLLHSRFQPALEKLVSKNALLPPNRATPPVTYRVLENIVKKEDAKNLSRYYRRDKFVGGHLQYWNKHPHPDDFLIRVKFQASTQRPLHLLSFCGRGIKGEDVFAPSLAPRFGLAAQYTSGDLVNYRLSYFSGDRGTVNFRKSPGKKLVAREKDTTTKAFNQAVLLEIIRWKGRIQFRCDGKAIIDWIDPAPLKGGFFSIRLMNMARGFYDDYEVYELTKSPFK